MNKLYIGCVADEISEILGNGYNVGVVENEKNNGVKKLGIAISKYGENVAPTYYVEDNGRDARESAERIVEAYLTGGNDDEIGRAGEFVNALRNANGILERLSLKVVNTAKNAEYLKKIPHRKFLDLSIIPVVMNNGNAAILKNSDYEKLGINGQIALERAIENCKESGFKTAGMTDVLLGLGMDVRGSDLTCDEQMYVITNNEFMYGATSLYFPDVFKTVADLKKSDLYVFPSSIHEVIVTAVNDLDSKVGLCNMVREINDSEVAVTDILADHIYYYDREKNEVREVYDV